MTILWWAIHRVPINSFVFGAKMISQSIYRPVSLNQAHPFFFSSSVCVSSIVRFVLKWLHFDGRAIEIVRWVSLKGWQGMKWKGGQWGMNPRILKEERKKNWKAMGSGLTDWQRTTSEADWSGQLMSVFQAILQIHKDNRGMIMQKSSHENKIISRNS